jgi:hypothetical protein
MSVWRCRRILLLVAPLALAIGGCALPEQRPMRVGSLPFPGLFTLYAAPDPDDLGQHRFDPFTTMLVPHEESRGILYTCEAGFLDLSHIRDTIDLSRHYYHSIHAALVAGKADLSVRAFSPCWFHVRLNLPREWRIAGRAGELPPEAEEAVIELSVQLAWIATTWYEILQWAGYKSMIVIPEGRSAFTYDDVLAHGVGADVARRALRECVTDEEYNDAATRLLQQRLEQLGVVPADVLDEAVALVHGHWWDGLSAIRRQLDIGIDDGTIQPWLVPGLAYCDHIDPFNPPPYRVPPLQDSLHPDGGALAEIEIEMRIFEAGRIRATIPDEPERIVPYRDFPFIMEAIRRDLMQQYGEYVDQPHAGWE